MADYTDEKAQQRDALAQAAIALATHTDMNALESLALLTNAGAHIRHQGAMRAASDLLYEIAAYTDDLRSGETDLDTFLDAVSDRLIPVADALERSGRG